MIIVKMKDLWSAFQEHGAECTGLILILMLLKYIQEIVKQISCCVQLYMHDDTTEERAANGTTKC